MAIVIRILVAVALGCSVSFLAVAGVRTMVSDDAVRTVCVGHFLLDVPISADVQITGSYRAVSVERVMGRTSFAAMKSKLQGRAGILEGASMRRDAGGDALDRKFGVDPEKTYAATRLIGIQYEEGRQVAMGYHDKTSSDGFTVELHRLIEDGHYQFTTKNVGADKYPAVRDSVGRAADRYVPLKNNAVPSEPGFCVGNGLFREDGSRDVGGDATLVVRFPQHRGMVFTVDVSGLLKTPKESPLRDRVDGDLALLSRFSSSVKTLRRGKVEYAGQSGYEVDISAPSERGSGVRMQKFFWGAEGTPGDPLHPLIETQLITDESGRSMLTDGEAEVIWSGLMTSMRLR